MNGAISLISAFHELNRSEDRTVAHFTPSLIGMFGSTVIFDSFLSEVESAVTARKVPENIRKRASNLISTFIPQVAEYNGIKNPSELPATSEELKTIHADTLENRRKGVAMILSALVRILEEAVAIQ
jgi:hypothetical protein